MADGTNRQLGHVPKNVRSQAMHFFLMTQKLLLQFMKMKSSYKAELDILVQKKKMEIPTIFSEEAVKTIFSTLEYTPQYLTAIAKQFDDKSSLQPIIEDKRSFRETLVHFLNFEGLNYNTIYPTFLISKPQIYPIHAEKDFNRLNLFGDFQLEDLLTAFCYERKKYLNFLKALKKNDWNKQMIESGKAREETIYLMSRKTSLHDFTHIQILKFQTNFMFK
ncbi:MAG: hypothetical protein IPL74_18655 [Bacteroidetes bacterium]|nr:hypothetical protein [Bacteroidota bacterium]